MSVLVVVPSRGRPTRMLEAARAALNTAHGDIEIVVLIDDDDPAADEYYWIPGVTIERGPRDGLVGKTNLAAVDSGRDFVVSFGDDHVCVTEGWDVALAEAIGTTGIAYGNDLLMGAELPTAAMVSADIIDTLGYMGPPELHHLYVDNFWRDLGNAAGCLHYCPDVVIRHDHPNTGRQAWDQTYREGNSTSDADRDAYEGYLVSRFPSDVEKVKALCR